MIEWDSARAEWAARQIGSDARVVAATGLREGGPPWRVRIQHGERAIEAIMRTGDVDGISEERAAMVWASDHGIPVPEILSAADAEPLLLIGRVDGTSTIPREPSRARLEAMGAIAARLHLVPPPPTAERRLRSIVGVDFAGLRRDHPSALWSRAEAALSGWDPDAAGDGFVHGDLWMGNTLWHDERLVSVIDWDCAGRGPAGVDLGSVRLDAATAFGPGAEDDVLRGWERETGRAADDLARWDVVAAQCTPPDMGWFTTAVHQQGRTDLDRELLVERRDRFLERALSVLGV